MGCIELSDGVTNRRIPVPELSSTVRIELTGDEAPRVIVPGSVTVDYDDEPVEASDRPPTTPVSVTPP